MAAPFDLDRLEAGAPVAVVEGVMQPTNITGAAFVGDIIEQRYARTGPEARRLSRPPRSVRLDRRHQAWTPTG